MIFTTDGSRSLASFPLEWVWQVGLIELDIDHRSGLWVVACDLLEVALSCLAQVLLCSLCSVFHEAIELNLFKMVASWTL